MSTRLHPMSLALAALLALGLSAPAGAQGTEKAKPPAKPAEPAEPAAEPATPDRTEGDGDKPDAPDEGGRALQEGELVSMLRGLLAQKERRIAGLLRELGAARTTARKEQLLSARAIENLTVARRRIRELETALASARKALGGEPEDKTPAKPADATPEDKPKDKPADAGPEDKPRDKPADAGPEDKPADATTSDAGSGEAPGRSPRDPRFAVGARLDPDKVIAVIDGEDQTLGDMLAMLLYNYGLDYLSAFVRIKLVEQEAARLKIHISEQEVVAWTYRQLIRLEKQAGGAEKFREKLEARKQSYENYEAALQRTAPYAIRLKRIITMRRATEEGKRTLERIAAGLYEQRFGPRVSGLHIFWRVPSDADEATWAKAWKHAETIHDKLLQGQLKFSKVAKAESDDENSAENGGKFGPVDRTVFRSVPVFNDVIFKLPRGGMRLLRSREGVHIVKVTKAEPATLSWKEAKRRLLEELIAKDPTEAEIDSLLKSLEKAARVERRLSLK